MKTKLAVATLFLMVDVSYAGLISRTYSYTDGNTITANENNTNENTLYSEINGNISTDNILDGTIQNGDVADTQFVVTKFASNVQSTFTYVNTIGVYRRPVLSWISFTTVDIENNTGTSNETCVHFPDQRRCVTENTGSTSVNRRFIITETASNSGTKNSGLRTGYVRTANTFYALYAWKVSDNSTDFVIVADTLTPVQANYATLNTFYGNNSWLYLGMIANGNNSDSTNTILNFRQTGSTTVLYSTCALNVGLTGHGVRLASTAGATSLTFTNGTTIPTHCNKTNGVQLSWAASASRLEASSVAGGGFLRIAGGSVINMTSVWIPLINDISLRDLAANSLAMDINLIGWMDDVLGTGYNPQL